MAGILDFLDGAPQGGILGGGLPNATPSWVNTLGIFGAALKDAGASLNGRESNSAAQFQDFMRQNQLRQAYALAANGDPSQRPQAYAAILAAGGDPSALQHAQAQQALPQLLQNLQPSQGFNDNPVGVTPAANAAGPGVDAARAAALQTNAAPAMSMQPSTLSGALQRTGSPELTAEMAPQLIQNQLAMQMKAMRTLSPQEVSALGLKPGTVAQVDPTGAIHVAQASDVKSKDAMDQQIALENANPNLAISRGQLAVAQQRLGLDKQKLANVESGKLDPDVLGFMAQQVLAGDKSPFQNLGRGIQGANNIAALRGEVMRQAQGRGLGGADLAALNAEFSGLQAGERTLGTRTANVEMAASETQNLIPMALAASKAVPRTQYPTLNKIQLAVQQGTGDENVVRLNVAVNGLVNTYARAISPSGTPTVSDKDHAREILDKAWSNGQFEAGVDQMNKEIAAARKSPGSVRGEFRSAISGRAGGAAAVPDAIGAAPSPQNLPRLPSKPTGGWGKATVVMP